MLWSNFSACFTVVHMKWLKGPETSQSQWSFVPSCVCISCVCDCVVCVLVCAPVQDVFKGCGGVPSEPMWAPPAGRRYSVIRPIDSTRAQKRRKCGAAVFGALFLTHPPSPPSDRCLLKWTLKTYLDHWGCLSHTQKGVRARWQLVYQIYLPAIDTIVTGMISTISKSSYGSLLF